MRNIYIADGVEDYVKKFVEDQIPAIGLIIGKSTAEADHVIRLTRCVDKESVVEMAVDNFLEVEGEWLGGMAVEICHMLPGGLDVIGVFAIATPRNELPLFLRQLVYQSSDVLHQARDPILKSYGFQPQYPEWITVQFDIKNGKCLQCKRFDLSKKSGGGTLSSWHYGKTLAKWVNLSTYFHMDDALTSTDASDLHSLLKKYVKEGCKKIANSDLLLDRKPQDYEGKVKNITAFKTTPGIISKTGNCKAYFDCSTEVPSFTSLKYVTANHTVNIVGGIFACVYLPVDSSYGEVVEGLKRDAILNLYYRCLLASEMFTEEELKLVGDTTIILPRRYALKQDPQVDPFLYFDYAFTDESVDSVIERFHDAFDLPVTSDMVITNLEGHPKFLGFPTDEEEEEDERYPENEDEENEDTKSNDQLIRERKKSSIEEEQVEKAKKRRKSKEESVGKKASEFGETDLINPLRGYNLTMGTMIFIGMAVSFLLLAIIFNYLFDENPPMWLPLDWLFSSNEE